MRFVTNHDKNAWDAPAVTKFGPDGLKLAVALVATMPGVPMIYTGEEVANDRKLSLFEKVERGLEASPGYGEYLSHPLPSAAGPQIAVAGNDGPHSVKRRS